MLIREVECEVLEAATDLGAAVVLAGDAGFEAATVGDGCVSPAARSADKAGAAREWRSRRVRRLHWARAIAEESCVQVGSGSQRRKGGHASSQTGRARRQNLVRTLANLLNRRELAPVPGPGRAFGSMLKCLTWRDLEMVDQITLSSNTPGSSNTLIFWLREVAAMRQAA